jgi:hypothetical protein
MGLNIALGDLDEKERGAGNFGHFHHEDWFAGEKDVRTKFAAVWDVVDSGWAAPVGEFS